MSDYTERQQEYIASVDGQAHFSAVAIIGELENEVARLRGFIEYALAGPPEVPAIHSILQDALDGVTGSDDCDAAHKARALAAARVFRELRQAVAAYRAAWAAEKGESDG